MSAPAPATDRELALEELRLALHRMLGAHRRLRSRDVRLLGGVSFSHHRLLGARLRSRQAPPAASTG